MFMEDDGKAQDAFFLHFFHYATTGIFLLKYKLQQLWSNCEKATCNEFGVGGGGSSSFL